MPLEISGAHDNQARRLNSATGEVSMGAGLGVALQV